MDEMRVELEQMNKGCGGWRGSLLLDGKDGIVDGIDGKLRNTGLRLRVEAPLNEQTCFLPWFLKGRRMIIQMYYYWIFLKKYYCAFAVERKGELILTELSANNICDWSGRAVVLVQELLTSEVKIKKQDIVDRAVRLWAKWKRKGLDASVYCRPVWWSGWLCPSWQKLVATVL